MAALQEVAELKAQMADMKESGDAAALEAATAQLAGKRTELNAPSADMAAQNKEMVCSPQCMPLTFHLSVHCRSLTFRVCTAFPP